MLTGEEGERLVRDRFTNAQKFLHKTPFVWFLGYKNVARGVKIKIEFYQLN